MAEYVRFNGAERFYGEKNILHGELELLSFLKRLENYKSLRKDELILRLVLKKKISELNEALSVLDKMLPRDMPPNPEKKKEKKEESIDKGVLSLEQEIEVIRRKLERLHG